MSLAIEWGDPDSDQALFIYFDAVTSYKTEYRGKVTEHPIDGGSTITDHFVKINPRINISGVITGADISQGRENITNESDESPINAKAAPQAVDVNTSTSQLNSLLPENIGQLFSPQDPEITFDPFPDVDLVEEIKQGMVNLISGEKFNEISNTVTNNMQLLKLYEYDGTVIRAILENLVAVNITFQEDANSGDALYCDITLEQIRFARKRSESLSEDVAESLEAKAATVENKGKQDSTEATIENAEQGTPMLRFFNSILSAADSSVSSFLE